MGIETQFEYDNFGLVTKTINALNTSRETESASIYDNIGQLLSVTDPENGVSSYEYDQIGNIISLTDPNGGKTEYSYDKVGRITETISPIGSIQKYTYTAEGLLETAVNSRGSETTYDYYKNGWLKSFTDELGTVSYTYDGNGNVLTVTDENGTITREYNSLNQVTKYTDFRGNTVKYSYDNLGNLVTLTYPGGRIVHYEYYKTGQIKTVTDWDGKITAYEYDKNGRLTKTSRPDGSVEIRTYDNSGRLLSQVDKNGETIINTRDYVYDESGNITKSTSAIGNSTLGLTSSEMEYDESNRLVKFNGETVEYDADGNMTYGPDGKTGEMVNYVYDCRNRLISADGIYYAYDAENNRISKTVNEIESSYVVDTSQPLSRILTEKTENVTTYFIYGTGLISQEKGGEKLYYHFNNIGSTEAVTDISGKIIATFTYGAYGELTSPETYGIMFLYNGEYGVATDENGLYYMRARYYNPEIKRFINQDVLIGEIANSPSLNRYAYVQGNPISLVDPFGLSPQMNWFGHALLDVLGMIPIAGVVADVVNAVWYFSEGDIFGGVTSIASAVPVVGDIAGLVGKGSKTACAIVKGTRLVGYSANVAIGGYVIGNVGYNAYQSISAGNYSLKQFAVDLLTVGMSSVSIGFGVKGLKSQVSNVTTKSTIGNNSGKDDFDVKFSEALKKLDKSGLRPGQTVISKSKVKSIVENYNSSKAQSSIYKDSNGTRFIVDGHHTTVASTILGKGTAANMGTPTIQNPSALNIFWTKKWYEFWKKTIKIIP